VGITSTILTDQAVPGIEAELPRADAPHDSSRLQKHRRPFQASELAKNDDRTDEQPASSEGHNFLVQVMAVFTRNPTRKPSKCP
jgi:hypothetical protein